MLTNAPAPPLTADWNVARRVSDYAARDPDRLAIAVQLARPTASGDNFATMSFAELDADSNLLADGLLASGVKPGMRLALLVPPGLDFISLVFALLKAGVVIVLIDPGMGRRNLVRCLSEAEPEGFVGIPLVQAIRAFLWRRFPRAKFNFTVGRRWIWDRGTPLAALRARSLRADFCPAIAQADDPAAIIFTTGSTGPPKGVLYRHGNFTRQAEEIRDFFGIAPGEIDLSCFPLFALFNAAMGATTVIPHMDATRPAKADPRRIVAAVQELRATQAFASPALWNVVGRYCEQHQITLPSLRRVLSAGAPVPPHVLRRMKGAIAPEGDVHTPYGATEALPVASIAASEVLAETAAKSAAGAGTCVGRRFPGIEWKVIRITDGPIATLAEAEELSAGEIGELIVRGPVVTTEYVTRTDCNPLHKIQDGETFWHRMGDVGYLESVVGQASCQPNESGRRDPCPSAERFWFCGRKSHRVITAAGTLFTIPCEAIFNQHPRIYRSALVGVGPPGQQRPVIFAEPWPEHRASSKADEQALLGELRELAEQHPHTSQIQDFFLMNSLPVDIRHNAKIFREKLAVVAAQRLRVPS
ncbi:MAG: fatty acid CoA ligase family protein [Pirellulaceae bacterium]|nr:fatty acid CoA ligase family protein [Pirellulaceae bacterium]